jgi:hypothetical protein
VFERSGRISTTNDSDRSPASRFALFGCASGNVYGVRADVTDGVAAQLMGFVDAPGEFRVAHCIAMDKRGRLSCAIGQMLGFRSSTRMGRIWQGGTNLGCRAGIAFSVNYEDLIYVFDSESDNIDNPGFEQGSGLGTR